MRSRGFGIWLPFAAIAAAGCDGRETRISESVPTVDVIVAGELTLDPTPIAVIGGTREETGHALHLVQDARLLENGGVVLAQEASQSLLYYASTGAYLRELGGPGGGPGEFERIRSVHLVGQETVVAWDAVPARLTSFHSDGRVSTASMRTAADRQELRKAAGEQPLDVHSLSSNLFVVIHTDGYPNAGKHSRESLFISVVNRNGEYVANIGRVEGAEWYKGIQLPLGHRYLPAVAQGLFYAGDGKDGRLTAFDSTGTAVHVLRLPAQRQPVSAADQREVVDQFLNRVSERARRSVAELLANAPLPDSTPVFTALRGTQDGNLWVRLYSPPNSSSSTWLIVDPARKSAESLEIERELAVRDASGDRVLLLHRDSLDREILTVRRYRPKLRT